MLQPLKTAQWRRNLAGRFPDDPRNRFAADALDKLAQSDVSTVDSFVWDELQAVDPKRLRDAVSAVSRAVSFQYDAKDLPDFVDAVLSQLSITIH